jgi:hypothetical protein
MSNGWQSELLEPAEFLADLKAILALLEFTALVVLF